MGLCLRLADEGQCIYISSLELVGVFKQDQEIKVAPPAGLTPGIGAVNDQGDHAFKRRQTSGKVKQCSSDPPGYALTPGPISQ